jgi:DNA-directed RNA polymerase specialized sigma subunit
MKPLTDEQQKFVEANHNLIYFLLKTYKWTIDKYYDVAAIGLCKAAQRYDASRNYAFSTYALRVMYNEVVREIRKEKAKKRSAFEEVSINGMQIIAPDEYEPEKIIY